MKSHSYLKNKRQIKENQSIVSEKLIDNEHASLHSLAKLSRFSFSFSREGYQKCTTFFDGQF